MNNILNFQQEEIFRLMTISSILFFDQFNVYYFQFFSKYKRFRLTIDLFDFFSFFDFDSSDDSFFISTNDEAFEYVFNDQNKKWQIEMKKQLQNALKIIVLCNAKDEKIQLYKKIEVYKNFIQLKYFETLKMYFEITIDLIKNEIKKTINEFFQLNCFENSENFFFNRLFLSLFINFVFVFDSFFFKIFKLLFKLKRIAKTMTVVKKKNYA